MGAYGCFDNCLRQLTAAVHDVADPYLLVNCLRLQKRSEKALTLLNESLSRFPDHGDTRELKERVNQEQCLAATVRLKAHLMMNPERPGGVLPYPVLYLEQGSPWVFIKEYNYGRWAGDMEPL